MTAFDADDVELPELTAEEFDAVTEAFIERLSDAMGRAGCNDLFDDEFPAAVVSKFTYDHDLLDAWADHLRRRLSGESQ